MATGRSYESSRTSKHSTRIPFFRNPATMCPLQAKMEGDKKTDFSHFLRGLSCGRKSSAIFVNVIGGNSWKKASHSWEFVKMLTVELNDVCDDPMRCLIVLLRSIGVFRQAKEDDATAPTLLCCSVVFPSRRAVAAECLSANTSSSSTTVYTSFVHTPNGCCCK